jgi:hypothetical protein
MRTMQFAMPSERGPSRWHSAGFLRLAVIAFALIAAIVCAVPAEAATVKAVQGQVLVNSGQGYRLVDGSTILEPGATVVANPGALAQVVYGGGCVVTVQPGSVYVVAANPPCQSGEPTQTGGLTDNPKGNTATGGGVGTGTAWTIGIAAVAGGGAIAYFVMSASP